MDVKEEKERFRINVDISGVATKDVDVTVEDGMLTIKGERSDEKRKIKKTKKKQAKKLKMNP